VELTSSGEKRRPPAPPGLGARGRRFWLLIVKTYDLEPEELELLVEVCRTLDTCDQLQQAIDDQGVTARGSTGQVRAHPALAELRGARLILGKLLAQLDLPDEDGASLPSPLSARGSRAARARWSRTAQVRELRRGDG
jgi:hypothetical protein